jgi:hypothetical protein
MYGRAESMPHRASAPFLVPILRSEGRIQIYRQGQEHRRSRCSRFWRKKTENEGRARSVGPAPEPQAGPLTSSPLSRDQARREA